MALVFSEMDTGKIGAPYAHDDFMQLWLNFPELRRYFQIAGTPS